MLGWLRKLRDQVAEYGRASCWRAARKAHLAKYPTCAACGSTDDLEVHHIKPVWLFPEFECEPSNLMTLCGPPRNCHWAVGHGYNFKGYRPAAKKLADTMLACVVLTTR